VAGWGTARFLLGQNEVHCQLVDLSVSGALLSAAQPAPVGASLRVEIAGVGWVPARVVRAQGDRFGVQFEGVSAEERDRLIHAIYSAGRLNAVRTLNGWRVLFGVARRVVKI
jgi:hypothetical protein